MKKIILVFVLVFVLSGCVLTNNNFVNKSSQKRVDVVSTSTDANCAKENEKFSKIEKNEYPENCCFGLTGLNSAQGISIGRKCYRNKMMDSFNPVGICINCGDGKCGDKENVCNCAEDCDAKNSNYVTVKDFCNKFPNNSFKNCDYKDDKGASICELCK